MEVLVVTVSVAVAGGDGGSGFSQTACDTKKIEQFNYKVRMKENSRKSEGGGQKGESTTFTAS